jgi:hypothetical protein
MEVLALKFFKERMRKMNLGSLASYAFLIGVFYFMMRKGGCCGGKQEDNSSQSSCCGGDEESPSNKEEIKVIDNKE